METALRARLKALGIKAQVLANDPNVKVCIFVEAGGKLYSFQSVRGWPILPSDIEGVIVDPVCQLLLDSSRCAASNIATSSGRHAVTIFLMNIYAGTNRLVATIRI